MHGSNSLMKKLLDPHQRKVGYPHELLGKGTEIGKKVKVYVNGCLFDRLSASAVWSASTFNIYTRAKSLRALIKLSRFSIDSFTPNYTRHPSIGWKTARGPGNKHNRLSLLLSEPATHYDYDVKARAVGLQRVVCPEFQEQYIRRGWRWQTKICWVAREAGVSYMRNVWFPSTYIDFLFPPPPRTDKVLFVCCCCSMLMHTPRPLLD